MSTYSLHSQELKDLALVEAFGENITYTFSHELSQEFRNGFPGYYIFKAPSNIVEHVYFDTFFKSSEYLEAINGKVFSNKWEKYIQERKRGDYYVLDARDYVGEIIRYYAKNSDQKFSIQYCGNIFWLYHDLGHVFLDHLYLKGSFKHKDEMDASVFAVIKLLKSREFKEVDIKREVMNAVRPLLPTGKFISKEDVKYFLFFMEYFKRYYNVN